MPASARRQGKKLNQRRTPSPASRQQLETASSEDRDNYIPPEVSNRMIRRVFWCAGIPSLLGISSFFVNYFLLVNHIADLPPMATFVESLLLFGLGFVGISYGVLSASWEPEPGSWLGIDEFRQNIGNMVREWRRHGSERSSKPTKSE